MSNERHNDERVSATYRSLAKETTPAHLDDKILQLAAAEAQQPRYSRWMAWSRPLAWAATITICLAITLELTREPAFESVPPLQKDEISMANDMNANRTQPPQDLPDTLAETMLSEKSALGRSASLPAAAEAPTTARQRASAEPAAIESLPPAEFAATVGEQLEAKRSAPVALEEERALAMSSAAYEADEAPAMDEDADLHDCSEEIRAEPETWLDCIVDLEKSGKQEAGNRQREALKETFPDFKLP